MDDSPKVAEQSAVPFPTVPVIIQPKIVERPVKLKVLDEQEKKRRDQQ